MRTEDKQRFANLMTFMGEVYDKPIAKERMAAWFELLRDYDIDSVERAAQTHMRESKFMATPAELIERMKPSTEQAAMLAWVEVPTLLRNSRAAKSADPVTERVIQDLGGWVWLGQKTAQELVWIAKEFASRYEMYAQHGTDVAAISGPRTGLRLSGGVAGLLRE